MASIQPVRARALVYDLKIGERGSYIAHGIVAHNKPDPYTIEPCPGGCGP